MHENTIDCFVAKLHDNTIGCFVATYISTSQWIDDVDDFLTFILSIIINCGCYACDYIYYINQ